MSEEAQTPEEEYADAFNEFADGAEKEPVTDESIDEQPEQPPEEVDWQQRAAELEEESKQWQHKFYSDAGRVGALQRKVNELEAEKQPQTIETPPEQAASTEESPPELAEFRDDYPDIYNGVEKYMETELERRTDAIRQEMQQNMQPVNQMFEQQQTAAEMAALNAEHPDWQQVASNAEFQGWVATQPIPVQQMANSDYASEVSYVLNSFKTQSQSQQPQSQPAASGIAQKRDRQLANASTVPSRGNATSTPLAEDDYKSAFAYYAAKKK